MISFLKGLTLLSFLTSPAAETTVAVPDFTVPERCQDNLTAECGVYTLNQIKSRIDQELPLELLRTYMEAVTNITAKVKIEIDDHNNLILFGNTVLEVTGKLVSTLARETGVDHFIGFSLQVIEARVLVLRPNNRPSETLVNMSSFYMDLEGIYKNLNRSVALAFISFDTIGIFLRPRFFNTSTNKRKTMMSAVVSIALSEPGSFTLKHVYRLNPAGVLFCVSWRATQWLKDDCNVTQTNNTHTTCSCVRLSTHAIIEITNLGEGPQRMSPLDVGFSVAFALGLLFLILSILTFVFCCRLSKVTNVALINLCLNLLFFNLVDLLRKNFLANIHPIRTLCGALAGALHFHFLSAVLWMFIEAVMLFAFVRNILKIQANKEVLFSWKWLVVIGYAVPMIVVGVSAAVFPNGYGNDRCQFNMSTGVSYTLVIPVIVIAVFNVALFVVIIITLIIAMTQVKNMTLQMSCTLDKNLMVSLVMKSLAQFFILGCPWILGFCQVRMVLKVVVFFQTQQGTFIFLVHCVLNQEVRQKYRKILEELCVRFKPRHSTA